MAENEIEYTQNERLNLSLDTRSFRRGAKHAPFGSSLLLPAAVARQLIPPVAEHPAVKVGDLGGRASLHDEAADAGRGPVIEVVKTESVAHLVEHNVDVRLADGLHKILAGDTLAQSPPAPPLKPSVSHSEWS